VFTVFTFSHLVSRIIIYTKYIINILRRWSHILFDGDGKGYVGIKIDVQFVFQWLLIIIPISLSSITTWMLLINNNTIMN